MTTVIAFSNDSFVIISLGKIPFSSNLYTALPASSHSCAFASDVAGFEAFPGKLIPIASTADAIVLAVYIPPHEPGPGHEQRSMACNCSVEISPLLCCPTPSNTDTKLMFLPTKLPDLIVPPYTNTDDTYAFAIPIIQPGIFLSQPPIVTNASRLSAPTTVSIEYAIKSRLGKE